MIEFSLSIDLGKKERIDRNADRGCPVDRAFVARALVALAAEFQAGSRDPRGPICDEIGLEVGSWQFSLTFEK
jgi:hypothetical protein